jgi:hypothetical protein
MSGIFLNIDPPPPHRPASVYPRLWCGERTYILHSRLGGNGGGGSIVWKTPDTALYSIICKYFVLFTLFMIILGMSPSW